jgi:hypothetical protein
MLQFFQKPLRLLQILCVEALSEPVVDLRQHLASFVLLALLLPQPGEASRCPQLKRLRLLLACNVDGLQKARFGFARDLRLETWGLGGGTSL